MSSSFIFLIAGLFLERLVERDVQAVGTSLGHLLDAAHGCSGPADVL